MIRCADYPSVEYEMNFEYLMDWKHKTVRLKKLNKKIIRI